MQFVIEAGVDRKMYGPFKSANAAVKWAVNEFALCKWVVVPVVAP